MEPQTLEDIRKQRKGLLIAIPFSIFIWIMLGAQALSDARGNYVHVFGTSIVLDKGMFLAVLGVSLIVLLSTIVAHLGKLNHQEDRLRKEGTEKQIDRREAASRETAQAERLARLEREIEALRAGQPKNDGA